MSLSAASAPAASSSTLTPSPLEAPARVAGVVRPGEGRSIRAFGNEILFKLGAEQTAGSLTLGFATVPPSGGPPPHVHDAEDEMFLILEGTYRVCLDGVWSEVGPGSVVYLPRGCVHTFHVVGATPGRHWVLTTPSGFERFYAQSAEVFAVPGPPDGARLSAIAAEHRYRFVPTADGPSAT